MNEIVIITPEQEVLIRAAYLDQLDSGCPLDLGAIVLACGIFKEKFMSYDQFEWAKEKVRKIIETTRAIELTDRPQASPFMEALKEIK